MDYCCPDLNSKVQLGDGCCAVVMVNTKTCVDCGEFVVYWNVTVSFDMWRRGADSTGQH